MFMSAAAGNARLSSNAVINTLSFMSLLRSFYRSKRRQFRADDVKSLCMGRARIAIRGAARVAEDIRLRRGKKVIRSDTAADTETEPLVRHHGRVLEPNCGVDVL